jgi:hypothetical protein
MRTHLIPRWLSLPLIGVVALIGLTACDAFQGEPEPIEAGELSQTFSGQYSPGGEISVSYPEGWAQGGDANSLILTNSQDLLDSNLQGSPEPDDAVALVSLLPGDMASTMASDPSNVTPVTILESFKQSLEQGPNPIELGDVEAVTLDGKEAAVTAGSSAQGDNLIIMVDEGDSYVNLVGITAEGQMIRHRETFERIAAATSYAPPETINADSIEPDLESDAEDILGEATAEATEAGN